MNEFLVLSRLTNDEKYIISVKRIAAVKGSSSGSDIYVEGLNQWLQVKESAEGITTLLRSLYDY